MNELKRVYSRFEFYSEFAKGSKKKIEDTLIEQKKLVTIMAEAEEKEDEERITGDDFEIWEQNQPELL